MTGLFQPPVETRSRTSSVLQELSELARQQELDFAALVERLGDRTYGLLLVVLAVVNVVPLLSLIAGPVMAGLGLQMLLGIHRPWFPARLLKLPLPRERTAQALASAVPGIRKLEKFVRPRWHFSEAPIVDRSLGLIILVLGLIVSIPAPFTNLPPSFVILLLGLGLAERDGLLQLTGMVFGLLALVLLLGLIRAWL